MSSFSCPINENITIVCLFYVSVFILTRYVRNPAKNGDECHLVFDVEKQNKTFWAPARLVLTPANMQLLQLIPSQSVLFQSKLLPPPLNCRTSWLQNYLLSAFCNSRANFSSALHILLLETGKKSKKRFPFYCQKSLVFMKLKSYQRLCKMFCLKSVWVGHLLMSVGIPLF